MQCNYGRHASNALGAATTELPDKAAWNDGAGHAYASYQATVWL